MLHRVVLHRVGIVVLLLSLLTSSLKFSPHFHSITLSTTLPQRDLLTSSLRLKKLSSSTYIRDSVIMTFLESENLHPKPYVSTITINSDSISKTLNPYGNLKINIHKIHQPNPPSKKTPGLRFDHIVGNVYDMRSTISKMEEIWPSKLGSLTNFAEFTAEEVGTPNSGLNSIVLNPLNSSILLPLNEGVDGLLKSQINTYLDFNKGEGVQHVALRCESVIEEVEVMKERGIEFLEAPVSEYYDIVKPKVSEWLNPGEFESCKKLGILLDVETSSTGTGLLMQIFTKPFSSSEIGGGMFLEVIERRGCGGRMGCGGFGKGNFGALFKGIEERERKEREGMG